MHKTPRPKNPGKLVMLPDGFQVMTLTSDQKLIDQALAVLNNIHSKVHFGQTHTNMLYAIVTISDDEVAKLRAMSEAEIEKVYNEHHSELYTPLAWSIIEAHSEDDIQLLRKVFMNMKLDPDYRNRCKEESRRLRSERNGNQGV